MKSYVLFIIGCLIFGKQISNLDAKETNESTTDISIQNTTVTETTITFSSTVVNNSTVVPNVTTTENPTTVAPSTPSPPSPAKTPSTGSWTVYSNDVACIKLEAAIQFMIPYEQTNKKNVTAYINVPKNATAENDTCSDTLKLHFNEYMFTIHFKNESNEISATNFNLSYMMDEKDFPGAIDLRNVTVIASNLTQFEAPSGKSYLCKVETTIKMSGDVTLSMQDLRVEAFRNKSGDSFSDAKECSGDEKINDIVPIAVGCALAVLVIIVLIAYLVGRQRSRQQGYQSV